MTGRLLCFGALLVLATALRAESVLRAPQFHPASGISMRVSSAYEVLPPLGFAPLRIQVKNPTSAAHSWQLRATHRQSNIQSVIFETTLRVDADSERTFEVMVPLATQPKEGARYSTLDLLVSGYAVTEGSSAQHSSLPGRQLTPFVGMGSHLAVQHWAALKDALEKKKSPAVALNGTPLDGNFFPSDWRALAGFEVIILSASEWRQLPAAQRAALSEWIAQGGRLVVPGDGAVGDLPAAGPLGCGQITHWPAASHDETFVGEVVALLTANKDPHGFDVRRDYTRAWKLAQEVGKPEPPQFFMIAFVLAFALVIGPVNFFVFAPSGNRHRLFWTTPLISIFGSLVMAAFIALSEGFGGSGQRFEAMLSLPDMHRAVLWQEQASRTGVLVSDEFTLSDPAVLLPVAVHERENSRPVRRERGASYQLRDTTWSGDWFRSRSAQAQALTAVRSDRARLEVVPTGDGPPVVVSSFADPLDDVWFFDRAGQAWRGKNLRPGERQSLAAADEREFARWKTQALAAAGRTIQSRAEQFLDTAVPGRFIATTSASQPIATLPAIRWKSAGAIIFGTASGL